MPDALPVGAVISGRRIPEMTRAGAEFPDAAAATRRLADDRLAADETPRTPAPREIRAHERDVARDLSLERVERLEPELAGDPIHERHHDLAAIEVAVEVEQCTSRSGAPPPCTDGRTPMCATARRRRPRPSTSAA